MMHRLSFSGCSSILTRSLHLSTRCSSSSATSPHDPVLLQHVLKYLTPGIPSDRPAYIVDATFGAGGYSRALLNNLPENCHLIGVDRDPTVLPHVQRLQSDYPSRFTFLRGEFGDLPSLLRAQFSSSFTIDGLVFDLGVSSMQLDQAERGFSFRTTHDGPLDMRMDPQKKGSFTAADVVNSLEPTHLAAILQEFGEEKFARRIAEAIVRDRKQNGFIETTSRLAKIVSSAMPVIKRDGIDPSTRTFQALRIYVNDELGQLERGLAAGESCLSRGGRLCVVSFHSLEDRIAKNFLTKKSETGSFKLLFKGVVEADEEERMRNPRSRSAKLRAAARQAAGKN